MFRDKSLKFFAVKVWYPSPFKNNADLWASYVQTEKCLYIEIKKSGGRSEI